MSACKFSIKGSWKCSAGTCSPDFAINESSPIVFIVNVLPPELGPVINKIFTDLSSSKFRGIALSSRRGCFIFSI